MRMPAVGIPADLVYLFLLDITNMFIVYHPLGGGMHKPMIALVD